MGEAKRRQAAESGLVWHHTSILRTNRIWMTGVIEIEGKSEGVEHPAFGPVYTNPTARRALRDFPAVAWFTSEINVPYCLQRFEVLATDKATGRPKVIELSPDAASSFVMNRVALGFPATDIAIIRWPEHRGYATGEGRDLNESARDLGDDPDRWWVADAPVDVLRSTAIRMSRSVMGTKLERNDAYLPEVHKLVRLCRAMPSIVIPPTWVGGAAHKALIASGGSSGKWDHLVDASGPVITARERPRRTDGAHGD